MVWIIANNVIEIKAKYNTYRVGYFKIISSNLLFGWNEFSKSASAIKFFMQINKCCLYGNENCLKTAIAIDNFSEFQKPLFVNSINFPDSPIKH